VADKMPAAGIESKFVMKEFPLGIGVRKGENRMLSWINEWVARNNGNGSLATIYTRFHG